jgi:hypothetical protein
MAVALLVLAGCGERPQDLAEAEVIRQSARATEVAVERQSRLNEQEISLRATAAAVELQGRMTALRRNGRRRRRWARRRRR